MKTILVTGANGQLGRCLQKATKDSEYSWIFKDSAMLDIKDKKAIEAILSEYKFDYCVNCAAYTNVEKAESEEETAFQINAYAVRHLAEICKKKSTTLIHISTDYVFDGYANAPYIEKDKTNPINVYGASKLKGEENIQDILEEHFILRTSWLYSEFGHNFYKTILRKAIEGETLNITSAQTGTPTNANDLAEFILNIIQSDSHAFGLYHFSNLGEASWYDFANEILKVSDFSETTQLNKDNTYQTIAKRPAYSVMNKNKLSGSFNWKLPTWEASLKDLHSSQNKN
jgi:dTDP-4-dehydrorhamnose reductase